MLVKITCFLQLSSLQVMPTVGVFPTCTCPVSHSYHGAAYHPTFPKCLLTGSHGDWGVHYPKHHPLPMGTQFTSH